MKITFLGTGTSQGVPVIACTCEVCQSLDFRDKRLRTSIHININEKSLVIDTGPDFRQQMLRERIKKLDAVLFTHAHKDHTGGLDDVRAYNFRQEKDMPIYAREEVLQQLKNEYSYAFAKEKYPGVPQLQLHQIQNKPFNIEGIDIVPIEALHYKMPVFGFRIKNFIYLTDAKKIPNQEKQKMLNADILVLNVLQKEQHISHLNLEEALTLIEEIKPKHTYFTHISHKFGLHQNIQNELPSHITVAYDGLKIIY